MKTLAKLPFLALVLIGFGLIATATSADPATRNSKKVERFGHWYVVKKPATYLIPQTGKKGRYTLCSAVLFAQTASLEFEAKNDRAWSFYVAKSGWNYKFARGRLSLRSGSRQIKIPAALYGGAMISGMSHDLQSGSRISISKLQSFIAQGKPISVYDNRGKQLVAFPNEGSDLAKAFESAIRCSLANAPG
ncbi:hypothetical protein NNA36_06600 [Shimia sp. CNT1-13L.2]|uniref:hypothetical protein n=1 Tax=Shimia sp. CNT1-13L.2 TaxID=2959663 RepID=UPI0020CCD99E|nr:hypothetical protein [Shimia sp. CNT1-13L.2]MCP9481630.1 hypothetical protein [Shimia sp. CNT1-13L.2]